MRNKIYAQQIYDTPALTYISQSITANTYKHHITVTSCHNVPHVKWTLLFYPGQTVYPWTFATFPSPSASNTIGDTGSWLDINLSYNDQPLSPIIMLALGNDNV